MALIADNPADRAEQLIVLTDRLAHLIEEETSRIVARAPTAPADAVEEKARLANAYRLELARIKDDRSLIAGAPQPRLDVLKRNTARLQTALETHEIELGAVKFVAEGLVQSMAEEINRQRQDARPYGAGGDRQSANSPAPVAIDRSA